MKVLCKLTFLKSSHTEFYSPRHCSEIHNAMCSTLLYIVRIQLTSDLPGKFRPACLPVACLFICGILIPKQYQYTGVLPSVLRIGLNCKEIVSSCRWHRCYLGERTSSARRPLGVARVGLASGGLQCAEHLM